MNFIRTSFSILLSFVFISTAVGQKKSRYDELFTAGHASAFIGGLYNGFYTYKDLLEHGNFGLGAPHQLDGELLVLDGKIYQTISTGRTYEIEPLGETPFTVVNFFKADQVVKTTKTLNKDQLYAYLDSVLPEKNSVYAIHIKGQFVGIKTRAFPIVTTKPYPPLASMLSLQQFFDFKAVEGDLVGYRIPAYLDGPNITGYHFHFLSKDRKSGGHIIELLTGPITIEIDELHTISVVLPNTADFKNFDFKKDRREEVKRVENGKAN